MLKSIKVLYLNIQISAKIYDNDTFHSFVRRVSTCSLESPVGSNPGDISVKPDNIDFSVVVGVHPVSRWNPVSHFRGSFKDLGSHGIESWWRNGSFRSFTRWKEIFEGCHKQKQILQQIRQQSTQGKENQAWLIWGTPCQHPRQRQQAAADTEPGGFWPRPALLSRLHSLKIWKRDASWSKSKSLFTVKFYTLSFEIPDDRFKIKNGTDANFHRSS